MFSPPKLIIFDLDGTLVEFPRDFFISEAERVLELSGFESVERSLLEMHFETFDFFGFLPEERRELFIKSYWEHYDFKRYPKPKPINGATNVLRHFHEKSVLSSIATARCTPLDHLRGELEEHTDFLGYLHSIAVRDSEDLDWMDKRIQIETVCESASVSPAETMLIGDIPADIHSARDAGVGNVIAVLSGGLRKEVLLEAEPDLVLNDVTEVPDYVIFDGEVD